MKSLKSDLQLKIINKIRSLRQNNNISQAFLGEIIGKSYGLVGNIESHKFSQKYTLEELAVIAKYFEYPFYKLFIEDGQTELDKDELIELVTKNIINYDSKRKNN
jgi:putative transcriptional regulator